MEVGTGKVKETAKDGIETYLEGSVHLEAGVQSSYPLLRHISAILFQVTHVPTADVNGQTLSQPLWEYITSKYT